MKLERVTQIKTEIVRRADRDFALFWPLQPLATATGLSLGEIMLLAGLLTVLTAVWGLLPLRATFLPLLLYPSFMTLQSISTGVACRRWSFFWIMAVLVLGLETEAGEVLRYSGLYEPVRVLLFLWLGNPRAQGNAKFYKALARLSGLS